MMILQMVTLMLIMNDLILMEHLTINIHFSNQAELSDECMILQMDNQ